MRAFVSHTCCAGSLPLPEPSARVTRPGVVLPDCEPCACVLRVACGGVCPVPVAVVAVAAALWLPEMVRVCAGELAEPDCACAAVCACVPFELALELELLLLGCSVN